MRGLACIAAAHAVILAPGAHAQWLPSSPASGSSRPGYCPAAYQTQTLNTASFTTANVDTAKTGNSGFQWYFWNFGTPGTWPSGDSITLNGDGSASVTGNSGPNGQMVSAIQTTTAPYFKGTVYGGGYCVEAQVSFDPSQIVQSAGHPSFWAMAYEHLTSAGTSRQADQWAGQATGYAHFIEQDFVEYFGVAQPEYVGTVIDWYGIYQTTCPGQGFCSVLSHPSDRPDPFRAGLDWTKWHSVGAVWVPATSSTAGSLQYFMDGQPLGPPFTWSQYVDSADTPPPTAASPWLFGVMDTQHTILMFGSNTSPINVKSVVVWQSSAAGNLTN